MGDYKKIYDHQESVLRFLYDLKHDGVQCYDIDDFRSDVIPSVYPDSYLSKCTHATVALSGNAPSNQQYMVICPYRVDTDRKNNQMVYDLDPTILVFDSKIQMPSPVAVVGYHQNFYGRTEPIKNFGFSDIATTVQELRKSVVSERMLLPQIPSPVEAALHHMAGYFQQHYVE
jgi:hypothetical protein